MLFIPPASQAPELIKGAAFLAHAPDTLAASYVARLATDGTRKLVSNAASRVALLRSGAFDLPVTIDDGTLGLSYVSSPHSAYVLYARDEIALLGLGRMRFAAEAVLATLSALLRTMRLNRAVHLDNWLLSTNLHGSWDGAGLAGMRGLLSDRFPDHFLIIRSLDPWTCPALLDAVRQDGWTLLPARQVWVTDDLAAQWLPRGQTRADAKALRRSGLQTGQAHNLSRDDCERIADLYHQLYVRRYSAINPIFTPEFIQAAAAIGLLTFLVARDGQGQIMAFSALRSAGGVGTVPLMGYDMTRPQSEGLYRIASYMAAEAAMNAGLRFHGSSGAGEFKRSRGARGMIEYMAVDARHLSAARRAGLALLAAGLNAFMKPMLERNGW